MDKTCLERGINCKKRRRFLMHFQFIVLFCLLGSTSATRTTCGGYIDIGSGTTQFYSPNYPDTYNVGTNCIWIIETGSKHRVNFNFTFTGERYNGVCSDYIEIRDGGPTSAIIGTYCDTHTYVNVESTSIWMYVQLRSDQIEGSGTHLNAFARAIYNSTTPTDNSDRLPECRSYEFECPNHICISMSYRCDDYNDCGCIEDCDEDGCGSLPINLVAQISISVMVGCVVFVAICLFAFLIEGKNSWSAHKKKIDEGKSPPNAVQSKRASQAFIKLQPETTKSAFASSKFDSTLKVTDYDA